MNFLKYRASRLRETLDPARPKSGVMDQIERLYDQAGGHEERDHFGQPPAGCLDCEAACGSVREFLRVGERRGICRLFEP